MTPTSHMHMTFCGNMYYTTIMSAACSIILPKGVYYTEHTMHVRVHKITIDKTANNNRFADLALLLHTFVDMLSCVDLSFQSFSPK